MKTLSLLIGCLLISSLMAACGGDKKENVRIGALLPLTGALQSYGEASQAALELARDTINEDSDLEIELVIKDTTTDPDTALAMLKELHDDGIEMVIGPYASSEVKAVKDYADANEIILVSPLSTATSLAVAGDHIYRFTPDDNKEGAAVAAVALDDGIKTIVPVSRDDAGNLGLQSAMKPVFEAGGGTVVEGVTYAANETDFEGVVADIVAAIDAAGGTPDTTAIYLTAFSEVVDLFDATATINNDLLTSVNWYGSDSVAQSADLVADTTAAAFAVSVDYPNPILGLRDEDTALWSPVVEDLQADLGRVPDSFALAAYDALVVAHTAFDEAGTDADADALGAALVTAANEHVGLTGPTVLNDAGDRASASFDFWAVCPKGDNFTWTRTISYAVAADGSAEVNRSGC